MSVDTVDYAALAASIAGWLRERLAEAGVERFVFGLSGGVDSAVVCGLCCRAAGPASVLAAIMPSHSNPLDAEHAELVAAAFGVTPVRVDLTPVADAFYAAMPAPGSATGDDADRAARVQLAAANVKPRLRMTTLYYLANLGNGIVVGSGNKTEARLGYFTKHGDGGVDLLPIIDLYKREVRGLARELGVPEIVITKPPSAGLWPGQTDESEIGATYEQLDAAYAALDAAAPCDDPALCAELVRRERATAHKRTAAPAFRRVPAATPTR
ncbi:MAG: NAD(+) synthase [Thermomicrobiales bacterium]|nr:NAD(+) synthase [Thermomicrobiales bacterium]